MEELENARVHHEVSVLSSLSPAQNFQQQTRSPSLLEPEERPLMRQKRKRTSPDDQAILEEAFKRDSKPDKAARLDIVKRVALSEKEVQIWFQNRRQTSRRKSRPLLIHEVVQYQLSRSNSSLSQVQSSPPIGFRLPDGTDQQLPVALSTSFLDSGTNCLSPQDQAPDSAARRASDDRSDPSSSSSTLDAVPSVTSSDQPECHPALIELIQPQTTTGHVGYLANRRSAPSLRKKLSGHTTSDQLISSSNHAMRRSSSFVRLSMTSDGSAEVTANSSPSPPRPAPTQASDADGVQPPSCIASKPLLRTSSGRSRDSRSWEFWCDKEARSELEFAAEKDMSGSAAGAISLFRSASRRAALSSMSSRANHALHRQAGDTAHTKQAQKRSAFARSYTAQGRLQSTKPGKRVSGVQPMPSLKHSVSGTPKDKSGNDSDKENVDPETDAEISAFMNGGRRRVDAAAEEEMDCVQGLLSLSQGNWR